MKPQMSEEWRDVVGCEGWYQVSTLGRVKRIKKPLVTHGKRIGVKGELILTPSLVGRGYHVVKVSDGIHSKRKLVHRIVAEAFIPNPENKPQIDHINRIKTDNRVENLRWVTNSENHFNMEHRSKLTAFGKTKSITQWSQTYGIKVPTIITRLKRGWSVEDAVKVKPLKEGEYLNGRGKDSR